MISFKKHVALFLAVIFTLSQVTAAIPVNAQVREISLSPRDYIGITATSPGGINVLPPGGVREFVPRFGEVYRMGEIISYNGRLYEVLQTFTFYGDPNWHPGIAPSLWRFVGMGSGTPAPGVPGSVRDFVPRFGEVYRMGEIIRYNGRLYEVLQTFTFYGDPNWHPGIAPSLWRFVGLAESEPPTYIPPRLTLTVASEDVATVHINNNSISLNQPMQKQAQQSLNITIIPDAGYRFVEAVADHGSLTEDSHGEYYYVFTFTMPDASVTISLTFEEIPRIAIHGIEFEQTFAYHLTDLIQPYINYVDVEVLDFMRGVYRITISVDDCTLDPRANPFFFWHSMYGTFDEIVDYQIDYASFVFSANPGTTNQNISLVMGVGVGDDLGQVARRAVILKGNDEPDFRFAVLEDTELIAVFTEPSYHLLSLYAQAGGRIINESNYHLAGEGIVLIAEAEEGYRLVKWMTPYGAVEPETECQEHFDNFFKFFHFRDCILRFSVV